MDDELPVLTDVVDPRLLNLAKPPMPFAAALAVSDGSDRNGFVEANVRQRVLSQIEPAVDAALGQHLARQIDGLLEQVRYGLSAEIKASVRGIVREAVANAVDAELEDLRNMPPRRVQG